MPKENAYVFEMPSYGTTNTCVAQALLYIFGSALAFGMSSVLNLYYICSLVFQMRDEVFHKLVEVPLYALAVIGISLAVMIGSKELDNGLTLDMLNPSPSATFCTVEDYPYDCSVVEIAYDELGIECRGKQSRKAFIFRFLILGGVAFFLLIGTMISIIVSFYVNLRKQKIAIGKKGNGGKEQISANDKSWDSNAMENVDLDEGVQQTVQILDEDLNMLQMAQEQSKVITQQALMYIAAFVMTWIFVIIPCVIDTEYYPAIKVLRMVFQPLQGFWNMWIFLMHKVHQLRRCKPEEFKSLCHTLKFILFEPKQFRDLIHNEKKIANLEFYLDSIGTATVSHDTRLDLQIERAIEEAIASPTDPSMYNDLEADYSSKHILSYGDLISNEDGKSLPSMMSLERSGYDGQYKGVFIPSVRTQSSKYNTKMATPEYLEQLNKALPAPQYGGCTANHLRVKMVEPLKNKEEPPVLGDPSAPTINVIASDGWCSRPMNWFPEKNTNVLMSYFNDLCKGLDIDIDIPDNEVHYVWRPKQCEAKIHMEEKNIDRAIYEIGVKMVQNQMREDVMAFVFLHDDYNAEEIYELFGDPNDEESYYTARIPMESMMDADFAEKKHIEEVEKLLSRASESEQTLRVYDFKREWDHLKSKKAQRILLPALKSRFAENVKAMIFKERSVISSPNYGEEKNLLLSMPFEVQNKIMLYMTNMKDLFQFSLVSKACKNITNQTIHSFSTNSKVSNDEEEKIVLFHNLDELFEGISLGEIASAFDELIWCGGRSGCVFCPNADIEIVKYDKDDEKLHVKWGSPFCG